MEILMTEFVLSSLAMGLTPVMWTRLSAAFTFDTGG